MDIGMFYGYEYEYFATHTISISPNCAFISLKINHVALYAHMRVFNPFDEIDGNEHNF